MRLWLADRVNRVWPFGATILLVGFVPALESWVDLRVEEALEAREPDQEPEPVKSQGKPGSRPEDLAPAPWPPGALGRWNPEDPAQPLRMPPDLSWHWPDDGEDHDPRNPR